MFLAHPHRSRLPLFVGSCFVFAFIFLIAPLTTPAQDLDDATFNGRVTDPNGAPIPGATITARLITTGEERTATTGDDGRYRLIELKPGTYEVRVGATGFADTVQTFEDLISGQTVRNDVELTIGITDNVEVTTEPPAVDITRTVVGGTITTEELESLPNVTRQALDFVFTLPGVQEDPFSLRDVAEDRNTSATNFQSETSVGSQETGIFSLSGSPAFSNNVTIDGLDNNDDRLASERFQPSIEAIAEVQVITNQFAAEYGRASGGRVNIRTRAGTNRFRGRGFYFFRDEALNANTFRNNSRGLTRLPLQQHNSGFTFSGPLYLPRFGEGGRPLYSGRDRTFFFVGYENDATFATQRIDTLVPIGANSIIALPAPTSLARVRPEDTQNNPDLTAAQAAQLAAFRAEVDTPNKIQRISARLDHRFTENHNIFGSVLIGRANNRRQFGNANRLEDALIGTMRDSEAIALTDNYVFSSTVVNQLRAQVSRLKPAFLAQRDEPVILISIRDSLDTDDPDFRGPASGNAFTLITNSSTSNFANNRREERFQIQDTLSVVRGRHTLKFGADIQYIRSEFFDLGDATGTFNFATAADFLAGRPSQFRQNFGGESVISNTYTGVFAQDEFQVRRNLTLSFGLRYENETVLRDTNNFGPRLALAYDPFGSGKTVIRAGGGIFYNRPLLRTLDDFTITSGRRAFNSNDVRVGGTRDANGNIVGGTRLADLSVTQRQNFVLASIGFPGRITVDNPLVRDFGTGTATGGGIGIIQERVLDPTIRIPESYQANVGVERDIGGRFVVEANYTFNRGLHLLREFNVNAPRIDTSRFRDFADFLMSQDFPVTTSVNSVPGVRAGTTSVRFAIAPPGTTAAAANAVAAVPGEPSVSLFYLNAPSTSSNITPRRAASTVLTRFRPNPSFGQIEQLASIGNSRYHGLTLELRRRFSRIGDSGFGFSTRVGYTLSNLKDDGIVNTSNATFLGDFSREFTRSRSDRLHRFVFSGAFDTPDYLGGIRFSPIVRLSSGAPFDLGLGFDRNIDDVSNDRPNFSGDLESLRSRERGELLPPEVLASLSLPLIGQVGNLPRNAGRGPGLFIFDITATRNFRISDRVRLRPFIEADNVLNKTVFTFANEFINFNTTSATFVNDFLVPTRTLRARQIRVGLRFDF